ncbi:hypothetical protein GCM10028821_04980 [Hymenobacter jeollabukensis]
MLLPLVAAGAFALGWFGRPQGPPAPARRSGPGPDYATELRGRFLIDSAECAGFEFVGSDYAIWRNEITCNDPDTFYLRWLDRTTFLAKQKHPYDEQHSPLLWVYSVDHYDGQTLRLRELWTGTGPFRDELQQLRRLPGEPAER